MLAVFDRAVAPSPEGLRQPGAAGLADRFREARHGAVTVSLGSATMAYSSHDQSPLLPRLFAAVDGIFCLFQGTIENIAVLKQQYGLSKGATEVNIVIEAYRTLRDRGPYPADQVVRDISGKFAIVLYDCSTKSIFMAADADGNVPFYWGVDSEGLLVVSDDAKIVKKACGKSFAPFPKGFFFTSSRGLQSYEHPLNEVKPVPRVDSKGEARGDVRGLFKHGDIMQDDGVLLLMEESVYNWRVLFARDSACSYTRRAHIPSLHLAGIPSLGGNFCYIVQ